MIRVEVGVSSKDLFLFGLCEIAVPLPLLLLLLPPPETPLLGLGRVHPACVRF